MPATSTLNETLDSSLNSVGLEAASNPTSTRRVTLMEHNVSAWISRVAYCVSQGAHPWVIALTLLRAKHRIGRRWQEALRAGTFGLDRATALILLRIAANKALANPQHWNALPASLKALDALATVDVATLEQGIQDGTIHSKMTQAAAEDFTARHVYSTAATSGKLTAALEGNVRAARWAKQIMAGLWNWPHPERRRAAKLLRALADQLQNGSADPNLLSQIV